MLRSILVGLDGSTYSAAASELGIAWAQHHSCQLAGIAVVDRPSIVENSAKAIVTAGEVFADELAEAGQKAEQLLEEFRRRCNKAGVAVEAMQFCGTPVAEILLEAQRHDVVLVGKQTYFQYETGTQQDDVVDRIIEHSPRPVVVTPKQVDVPSTTLIAYDSSLQAAKTLNSFVTSGLADKRTLHMVSVDEHQEKADHKMRRAVDYLQKHGLFVETHAIASEANVGEVLLDQVAELRAGLLVMGVFGKPSLQSFFFGSTTQHILKNASVPVFVDH